MANRKLIQRAALAAMTLGGLALTNAPSQAASIQMFKAGTWQGEAYTNDATGKFSHCSVYSRFQNGNSLAFVLNRDLVWSFAIFNNSWTMPVGNQLNVSYSVSGGQPVVAQSKIVGPEIFEVLVGDGRTLLPQLVENAQFDVHAGNGTYRFTLPDLSRQLGAVAKCVKEHSADAGTPPQKPASPDAAPKEPRQPEPAVAPQTPAATPQAKPNPASTPFEEAAKHARAKVEDDGTLVIYWRGAVIEGMADVIRKAFDNYANETYRVVLDINSPGGSVEEGDKVIHVLQVIRKTHKLATWVGHGGQCASMCIPIYLQGDVRVAAADSNWVFHEVTEKQNDGTERVDDNETMRLFRRYYVLAGVSVEWINSIIPVMHNKNLWRSGQELFAAHTGVITNLLNENEARPNLQTTSN